MFSKGKRIVTMFNESTVNKRGAVEIIALPFHEGSHICTNIDQAIAVAQDLQRLHEQGYVHGDIRALNIVFSSDATQSRLIDFDFGGQAGTRFYPDGYRTLLADGHRKGEPGKRIEMSDDVYALWYVIWKCHYLPVDSEDTLAVLWFRQSPAAPKSIDVVLSNLQELKENGVTIIEAIQDYKEYISNHFSERFPVAHPTAPDPKATNPKHQKNTPADAQVSPAGGFISHSQLRNNKRKASGTTSPANDVQNENVLKEKQLQ